MLFPIDFVQPPALDIVFIADADHLTRSAFMQGGIVTPMPDSGARFIKPPPREEPSSKQTNVSATVAVSMNTISTQSAAREQQDPLIQLPELASYKTEYAIKTRLGSNFTATVENDTFFGTADRNYTHGMRFEWLSHSRSAPLTTVGKFIPSDISKDSDARANYGLMVGQEIYTPESKTKSALGPNDRPYAGWLYVKGLYAQQSDHAQDVIEVVDFC